MAVHEGVKVYTYIERAEIGSVGGSFQREGSKFRNALQQKDAVVTKYCIEVLCTAFGSALF